MSAIDVDLLVRVDCLHLTSGWHFEMVTNGRGAIMPTWQLDSSHCHSQCFIRAYQQSVGTVIAGRTCAELGLWSSKGWLYRSLSVHDRIGM